MVSSRRQYKPIWVTSEDHQLVFSEATQQGYRPVGKYLRHLIEEAKRRRGGGGGMGF